MIITCSNCNKKFEIDKNLIPNEGRLLQCGSCNHKWFFKIKNNKEIFDVEEETDTTEAVIEKQEDLPTDIEEGSPKVENETIDLPDKDEESNNKKIRKKININYFKIILVIIISFIALIFVLDTFKTQFSVIFPNIEIILDNLYQSIKDIELFILDLIK